LSCLEGQDDLLRRHPGFHAPELHHCSFSPSERRVEILSPIVEPKRSANQDWLPGLEATYTEHGDDPDGKLKNPPYMALPTV
jgi:hypothetical protein